MALASGSSVGHYRIVSLLGAGGMGEVYLARDTRLKRDVALKVLPEPFANDRERLARITREAEVLASLNHPHIAAIYGVEDGALVMELAEGAEPHGPMSFEEAWQIGSQVVDALEYAHDKGIVHRDLKPANVKVSSEGSVKLLDFGLAKAFTDPAAVSGGAKPEQSPTLTIGATQMGVILGTAAYMSPEQAKGKTVDKRADIWAFGVMFYELLTGQRLFKGEDIAETLAQVLTKEPELSHVPARARKLLRRCLERDPRKRLRDIGEVRHYIEESAAVAVQPHRPRVLPWAIAVAAMALAGVAWWMRPAHEQPVLRSFILAPESWSFRCNGDDAGPAVLSPDGKRLAFAATASDGKVLLWIRPLDSMMPQPLAGTEGALFPFWSPDSRSLGFFADGKLKRIDAAGGTVNSIADAPITRGGAWSRDDVILFAPGFLSPIMRVGASGGAVSPVTRLDPKLSETSHRWPSFLPDGKHFLYTSRGRGVFLASIDGKEAPRRLLEESSNALFRAGYILYSQVNVLLARPFDPARREFTGAAVTAVESLQSEPASDRACFSAADDGLLAYHSRPGEFQMTWFDMTGKRIGTVGAPGLLEGVEIAPDGKRAAVVISDGSGSRTVWIYEFDRKMRSRISSAKAAYTGIAWSHDGKRLAMSTSRDYSYVIFAKEPGGSGGEELLVQSKFETNLTQWLPKDALVVMLRDPKTGWDLGYFPPGEKGAERKLVPVVQTETNEYAGVVSPDGRWIAFSADDSTGADFQAYVASFPAGKYRRQISTIPADVIRWSPGGKEILFASHGKLMAAAVHPAGDELAVEIPRLLFEFRVNCISLEASCFDVTPDGRLLVVDSTGPPPPIALVQNWTAALKK